MRVEIAYAAHDVELLIQVEVAADATLGHALQTANVAERIPFVPDANAYAIFGKRATLDTRLREGDRIEITRPLLCDPKLARRTRANAARRDKQ
jgi:putative ubiquitin-RnfH superfamily antitoxin RatB of RatAB toxin-antitoxin module